MKKIAITGICALVLTACGGGSSSSTTAATAAPATAAPATLATPALPAGAPTTAATAGTLPFLALTYTGAGSTQNVAITGSGASSVMTFTSPAFTLTGADSASPSFSANGGQVKAGGNVISYCSAGIQTTATTVENKPFQNGHRIFISANLTQVTSVAEVKGLSFSVFNCTGKVSTVVVNAAGDSLTFTSPTGSGVLTGADLSAMLSDAGRTKDGSTDKARFYKYTAAGVSKYFLVGITGYTNPAEPNVSFLELFSQN